MLTTLLKVAALSGRNILRRSKKNFTTLFMLLEKQMLQWPRKGSSSTPTSLHAPNRVKQVTRGKSCVE
jgi:hypothetical protein